MRIDISDMKYYFLRWNKCPLEILECFTVERYIMKSQLNYVLIYDYKIFHEFTLSMHIRRIQVDCGMS